MKEKRSYMLSRNNRKERIKKLEEKNNRFSIRKFAVGAASVLIGAFFIGTTEGQTVHADATPTTEQVAGASTESKDSVSKVDQTTASSDSASDKASEASDQTVASLNSASDKTSEVSDQTKDNSQTLQSEFNQAAQNPGKPASSANTALNNASDADLTEMANLYNSQVAQNTNPNPAQSQSDKDGHTYTPTDRAATDPKAYIKDPDKNPEGTTYSFLTSQDKLNAMLMQPGQHEIAVLVTFPDGSYQVVRGQFLNVVGSDVQTVTVDRGSDPSSIDINKAVTDIVPAGDQWNPQSAQWTVLPDTSEDGVSMGQAEVTYATGNKQVVVIPVRVQTAKDVVNQDVDFRMPDSDSTDATDYYYKTFDSVDVYKTVKDADGQYSWNSVTFDNQPSLDSILSGDNFTYDKTGLRNYSIPAPADGYVPKIVGVQVTGGDLAGNDPIARDLLNDVWNKVQEDPYTLPTYTVPAGETHGALSVTFQVTYVKSSSESSNGKVLTQPELPAYTGSVSGIPLTQPELPEAPLPQEPSTPTTPSNPSNPTTPTDNNNNTSGQPTDTNKGNVAPHAAAKPNKGGHSNGKGSSVGNGNTGNTGVKSGSNNSIVHAATIGNNNQANGNKNQEKANTLPQTGSQDNNMYGLIGLMFASLGSIVALAGSRKRRN